MFDCYPKMGKFFKTFLKVEPETKVCFKSKNEEKLKNIGFYFDQVKNVLLILGPTTKFKQKLNFEFSLRQLFFKV